MKVQVNLQMEDIEKEQAVADAENHGMGLSEYIRWLLAKERK